MSSKLLTFVLSFAYFASFVNTFSIASQNTLEIRGIISGTELKDEKGNITDLQLTKIKKLISEAQSNYSASEYTKIGRYIFDRMKGPSYQNWNVHIYNSSVRQVGLSVDRILQNKYLWFFNYGKYNLTYVLYQIWVCSSSGIGGSGTAQFGQQINATVQQQIKQIINNSIIYKGDDIQSAAQYIYLKVRSLIVGRGRWMVIITSPTTTYGYCMCKTYEIWAALRNYGDLKWNYYIAVY